LTHKTDKNENINVHIEEESINKKKIIKFHWISQILLLWMK
jgi:hypothetical protein